MRAASSLSAVLVCLAGCPRPGGEPDGGAALPAAPHRGGVKVPLPEGWTARVEEDQSFQSGPASRSVLRIDLRPGAGEELPTAEGLKAALVDSLRFAAVSVLEVRDRSQSRLLIYQASLDGGAPLTAMVGAKRVGRDLFLCASLPGASGREVEKAAQACEALEVGEGWGEGR